jgi:mono/diheme cytochrome c family protein
MLRWLLSGVVLLASAALAQEAAQGDAVNGAALAGQLCRGCHLISATDRGPVPDGVPSFVAIASRPEASEAWIRARILGDHPIMPQPPLTAQQNADVAAYIFSLRE